MREWLPAMAAALGAPPPRRVPVWLAWLVAGENAVLAGTRARGASNAKAKRELGWTLRYPTWRTGFAEAYRALAGDDPHARDRPPEPVTPRT
jgi:nucleoside-diphosphate-sugar epimerase